jgi:hypothetical protein
MWRVSVENPLTRVVFSDIIISVNHTSYWEADSRWAYQRHIWCLVRPGCSLPCSQNTAIGPCLDSYEFKYLFNTSSSFILQSSFSPKPRFWKLTFSFIFSNTHGFLWVYFLCLAEYVLHAVHHSFCFITIINLVNSKNCVIFSIFCYISTFLSTTSTSFF